MANRSYLYSTNKIPISIPASDLDKAEKKVIGISEYKYDIPITFKILLSINTQKCHSLIYDEEEGLIALCGDYEAGVKKLEQFFKLLSEQMSYKLPPEVVQFIKLLNSSNNHNSYFILEAGEIFEMGDDDFEAQNSLLLKEIQEIDINTEIKKFFSEVVRNVFDKDRYINSSNDDCSYLYSTSKIPSSNLLDKFTNKFTKISECSYNIPLIYKVLLSVNTQKCGSLIFKTGIFSWIFNRKLLIALCGDYEGGVEKLEQFFKLFSEQIPYTLPIEAGQFIEILNSHKNRNSYFVLEAGEIFDIIDDKNWEAQNSLLLTEIQKIDINTEIKNLLLNRILQLGIYGDNILYYDCNTN